MLLHRMSLISLLGNLREFFKQIVYRPPGEKLPYASGQSENKSVNFQLVVKNGGNFSSKFTKPIIIHVKQEV